MLLLELERCSHVAVTVAGSAGCPAAAMVSSFPWWCGFNLSGGSCQLSASLLLVQHAGPDRSIIKQSYDARERLQDPSLPNHLGFGNLNGDGFGIGWYAPDDLREGDPTPCMYKSITPAW